MNRIDALAIGLANLAAASKGIPRRQHGTAPDRVAAAVLVAEFLMRDSEHGGEELPTAEAADYVSAGPARSLECDVTPGDRLFVRGAKAPAGTVGRPLIGIEATSSDGALVQVVVSPARARTWAAGILDAADEADGTTPLNFVKGDPEQ